MVNKKFGARLGLAIVALTMLITACKTTPSAKQGGNELAPWKGEWTSVAKAAKSSELDSVCAETAKKMPNYTTEGFKDAVIKMYDCPVVKIKFNGTNTVKMTLLDKDQKEKTVSCGYEYVGKEPMKGYKDFFWETFELKKSTKELRAIRFLAVVPPHAHGDGPKHWHARFGARDIKSLVENEEMYWPTFMQISEKEMINSLQENIPNMYKMFPKVPFVKFNEIKKWISIATIAKMNNKEINAVYDRVIKKYAGKNPKGGDFSKEEIAKIISDGVAGDQYFSHIEFVVGSNKDTTNKIILWKNNKKVFESSYKRIADPALRHLVVLADKENAGRFKIFSLGNPHGGDYMHIHFQYGETYEAFKELKGFPTFVPANNSMEQNAKFLEGSCDMFLGKYDK